MGERGGVSDDQWRARVPGSVLSEAETMTLTILGRPGLVGDGRVRWGPNLSWVWRAKQVRVRVLLFVFRSQSFFAYRIHAVAAYLVYLFGTPEYCCAFGCTAAAAIHGKKISRREGYQAVTHLVSLWFVWKSVFCFGGQIREREEEISALLLRVRDAEGRSKRITEDKEEQLRLVQ